MPHITSPTRITPRSKTLIDNIFSTDCTENSISGNIITSISDHLAQFLLFPIYKIKKNPKKDIFERNYKNFHTDSFLADIKNINWNLVVQLNQKDVDFSFENFFAIFETILDAHAPLEKLSNSEKKQKLKPWITKGIKTSVKKEKGFKISL